MPSKKELGLIIPVSSKTSTTRRPILSRPVAKSLEPSWATQNDPTSFQIALILQMTRHGDTYQSLYQAIVQPGDNTAAHAIKDWVVGTCQPRFGRSYEFLARIERRYRLPENYFKNKIVRPNLSLRDRAILQVQGKDSQAMRWHLPMDFDARPVAERQEIIEWTHKNVLAGITDYGKYVRELSQQPFAVHFPNIQDARPARQLARASRNIAENHATEQGGRHAPSRISPPQLEAEMTEFIRFKTAPLSVIGFRRMLPWGKTTARQKLTHYGLLFGAFIAAPDSSISGLGVAPSALTLGLLAFPSIWDWYLKWRERRRGFYSSWEVEMLWEAVSLNRPGTGWIRQNPEFAKRLLPIEGIISRKDITLARRDWNKTCDIAHNYALERKRDIRRLVRSHRDTFEPILPILEAENPLREYRKITDEILRRMPNEEMFPKEAAEAIRSYLILRFGMHTGLRQRNLRELLLCARGDTPKTDLQLEGMRRGELRWCDRDSGWEIHIPSVAFKNYGAAFFSNKPYRLLLPDSQNFYAIIDAYITRHRPILVGGWNEGAFFVRAKTRKNKAPSYNAIGFYDIWRRTIQRYGIYNPYTDRGAIEGLLPHGPHNIRDILATHILKQTGSYVYASYAIQNSPGTVAKHYARFLPKDKIAYAARILNEVWVND